MNIIKQSLFFLIVTVIIATVGGSPIQAQDEGKPGILLTPTRVVLEGRERSATVSIANNGNAEGAYRVEFVNRRMLESGGFENAEEAKENEKFADSFLRISPRRFTLAAGQSQSVRILARKPADLEEGEYRSHLRFIIVPNSTPRAEKTEGETLSISIRANFGMSIPVIVRHGAINASITASDAKYTAPSEANDNKHQLAFTLLRDGKASVYGDVEVVYQPTSGSDIVVKKMGGIAIYTPNDKRLFNLALDVPEGTTINGGKLKVTYREKAEAGGRLLASSEVDL